MVGVKRKERENPKPAKEEEVPEEESGSDGEVSSVPDESGDEMSGDEMPQVDEGAREAKKAKAFASAFSTIMSRTLEKTVPIMANNEKRAKEVEEERKERNLRKKISADTKMLQQQAHVKPDPLMMVYEKQLRKIATKGVVRLFNAVKEFQDKQDDLPERQDMAKKKQSLKVDHVSKEAFLSILKGGKKEGEPKAPHIPVDFD